MEDLNKIINDYFQLQSEIHEAFGYVEDWRVIPLEDRRRYPWFLIENKVVWTEPDLMDAHNVSGGNCYSDEIYKQRFLPKYVYRTESLVLISVDTRTDGNKFLSIYDAAKECKDPEIIRAYEENWG